MEVRDEMEAHQHTCQHDRKAQAHHQLPNQDDQAKVILSRHNHLLHLTAQAMEVHAGVHRAVHRAVLHQVTVAGAVHLPEAQVVVVAQEEEDNHCVFRKC